MLRFYNKKKIDVRKIIFYVNLLIFLCSAGYLTKYYISGYQNRSKIEKLNNLADDLEPEVDEEGNVIDRYASIRDEYPDIRARLTYKYYKKDMLLPVMQTTDNDFYLYRDVEGNDSKAGTPFIDYRCDAQNSLLMIIYAHNMKDLSQFGAIKEYREKSYWKKYPTIIFETQYEEAAEYEVFAAFYSQVYAPEDDAFKYYNHFSLDTEEEYNDYITNIKKMALYETDITPQYGEKLIVMSTCDYTQKYVEGRFAIIARKTGITVDNLDENGEISVPTEEPKSTEEAGDTPAEPTKTKKPSKTTAPSTSEETKTPEVIETEAPAQTEAPVQTEAPQPTPEPQTKEPEPTVEPQPEPTKEPTIEPEPTIASE